MATSKVSDIDHIECSEAKQPKVSSAVDTDPVYLYEDDMHIPLTWRSWVVVFVASYAQMTQIFTVTAAGSSIAFIIRDIGNPGLAGWIIQAPLLVQTILSPIVGRLSDVLDRKLFACILPLFAFAGAVISARATSIDQLIGGGIMIGLTLPTIAIVQAIPSEVLPLKYRPLSNSLGFIGGTMGGLLADLGGGAVTNLGSAGWRNIFWIQAALHLSVAIGIGAFYWPAKRPESAHWSWKQILWACDPVGSLLLTTGLTMIILSLDWAGGTYPWSNGHVIALLVIGAVSMIAFALYEWKGRDDGLIAHVFFVGGPNFTLAMFAIAVEGWIFFSAVNNIVPLIILNVGFETTAWRVALRSLVFVTATLSCAAPIALIATKRKDLKTPLLVCFCIFLAATICYSNIHATPAYSGAQWGFNVLSGIGSSGPLTLLSALIQFSAPNSMLSTATGLAFSARALGGAFGSAVVNTIVKSKLQSSYASSVGSAAVSAGLPSSSLPELFEALETGDPIAIDAVPGINYSILGATMQASHVVYASAYRLGWLSIIPFVVLALVAIAYTHSVKNLMTDKIEATVELMPERVLN